MTAFFVAILIVPLAAIINTGMDTGPTVRKNGLFEQIYLSGRSFVFIGLEICIIIVAAFLFEKAGLNIYDQLEDGQ